jgi:sterol desaturase/sphingolipid hydroxylase (fatty acid hydroxylase superfamily)
MLLDFFEGLPFYGLWPALAAIGVAWYLLICGGLYLFLHRSPYAEAAWRFKTQLKPTRAVQVRGEIVDGVLSMCMAMGSVAIAFWCYYHGYNRLYASPSEYPLWYIPVSIFGVFVVMEVFEWAFHWSCHRNDPPWMPSPHSRFLVSAWHHNEHHAGSLDHNYGFFTGFMDIAFKTRLTPNDKVATRPNYRCTECRDQRRGAAATAG